MLVARRDPILDVEADDRPVTYGPQASPGRFKRLMGTLQMAGTVLGIPVALASGYSIYHANFSPEVSCQGLRTNIIAMLDKNADASTLRTLVLRDVAAFEQNCGRVDPDAVAAFKTLLAAPVQPPLAKTVPPAQVKAKLAAREPAQADEKGTTREPAPQVEAAKPPVPVKPVAVESDATTRAREVSDANWLAAVRSALVLHDPEQRTQANAPVVLGTPPQSLAAPAMREAHAAVPAPAATAPALPPAQAVPSAPAPSAEDHPVPPGSIPDATSVSEATPAPRGEHRRWRLRSLLAHLPVLRHVVIDDDDQN